MYPEIQEWIDTSKEALTKILQSEPPESDKLRVVMASLFVLGEHMCQIFSKHQGLTRYMSVANAASLIQATEAVTAELDTDASKAVMRVHYNDGRVDRIETPYSLDKDRTLTWADSTIDTSFRDFAAQGVDEDLVVERQMERVMGDPSAENIIGVALYEVRETQYNEGVAMPEELRKLVFLSLMADPSSLVLWHPSLKEKLAPLAGDSHLHTVGELFESDPYDQDDE